MKLVATNEKVQIQWFWVATDGSKIRNNKGFIHNAWDAKCSCGWETHTGGGIKAWVKEEIEIHKVRDHNYSWEVSA